MQSRDGQEEDAEDNSVQELFARALAGGLRLSEGSPSEGGGVFQFPPPFDVNFDVSSLANENVEDAEQDPVANSV